MATTATATTNTTGYRRIQSSKLDFLDTARSFGRSVGDKCCGVAFNEITYASNVLAARPGALVAE